MFILMLLLNHVITDQIIRNQSDLIQHAVTKLRKQIEFQ